MCDERLFTLPNDERVKVESTREVLITIHRVVKRRVGDLRYVPMSERNLISLGRLEAKGCTFQASGGTLKGYKGILVPMKGKRSDSNLYELQVNNHSLGHKLNDGVVCGSTQEGHI